MAVIVEGGNIYLTLEPSEPPISVVAVAESRGDGGDPVVTALIPADANYEIRMAPDGELWRRERP